MIQTNIALPDNPDIAVQHIGPDQLPYVCIYEPLANRVDNTISWHYHQYFEVAYVAEGEMECRTPNHTLRLTAGEAVFVNTGVLHMYQKTSAGPCVIYAHIFDSTFLTGTLSSSMYEKYIYPIATSHTIPVQAIRPENHHQVRMLEAVQAMIDIARKEAFGYEFHLQSQLSQFWCWLLILTAQQQTQQPTRAGVDVQRMKIMLQYIHENYPRRLTLKEIANAATISERECSRCFRRCFQESAITYLNKYRIQMAARMLLESQESIRSISQSCGFHSDSYFCKQFQQFLGCTPKDYRKKSMESQTSAQ